VLLSGQIQLFSVVILGSVAIRKSGREKAGSVSRSGSQGIELVCGGRHLPIVAVKLPLFEHVHGLDAGEDPGGRSEGFEAEHGPNDAFDGALNRPSSWTDLSCQCVRLVGKRHRIAVDASELILADHVHELDAGQYISGRLIGFEVGHGPSHSLDSPVVLLDYVVEIFDLAHDNGHVPAGIDRIDGRLVSAPLLSMATFSGTPLPRSDKVCRP
jgi:hypothetical protein